MKWMVLIIALASIAAFACPVSAAIKDVGAGGTVFIGEQGLDISAGTVGSTQIAWFPSTASTTSTVPDKVIDVTTTKTSFYVSPTDFSSRTGNWYSWLPGSTVGASPVAFKVDDPYLALKVDDMDAGVDVTNKWLYRGDEAQFRIETNLYTIGQRIIGPGSGVPVTIKFQTPDGAILTALTNKAVISNTLVDIPVGTSPYSTGRIWDSINSRYSPGTYTLWVECNANSMKDNYPQEGKTTSFKVTVLVTEFNPLIKSGTPMTTTPLVTTVTTRVTTVLPTTKVKTMPPATTPVMETTISAPPTVPETGTVPETPRPTPARTYADGFTALVSVAACCAAAVLLINRSR